MSSQKDKALTAVCKKCNKKKPLTKAHWYTGTITKYDNKKIKNPKCRSCKEAAKKAKDDDASKTTDNESETERDDAAKLPTLMYADHKTGKWLAANLICHNEKNHIIQLVDSLMVIHITQVNRQRLSEFDNTKIDQTFDYADIINLSDSEEEQIGDSPQTNDDASPQTNDDELKAQLQQQIEKYKRVSRHLDSDTTPQQPEKNALLTMLMQQQSPPNITSNNKSDSADFLKRMWQDNHTQKWTMKFPRNEREFWAFLAELDRYKNEHNRDDIPEKVLTEKILKSVSRGTRQDINQYKNDCEAEYKARTDNLIQQKQLLDEFKQFQHTFKFLEAYIIKRLSLRPSIHFFLTQIRYIRTAYNENPEATHRRIVSYLNQIQAAIEIFNETREARSQIRQLSQREKQELYERVFIHENNTKAYNNDGKLNSKVKKRLCSYVETSDGTLTLDDLIEEIKSLPTQILPSSLENKTKTGEHWQKFRVHLTIFQLKPVTQVAGRKRSRDSNDQNGPSSKRRRISHIRCRNKKSCKKLKLGTCNFRHTREELKSIPKNPDHSKPTPRSPNTPNTPKPINKPCKFGDKCRYKATCRFQHPNNNSKFPICPHCNKRAKHKPDKCWSNPNNKKDKPTYDPNRRPHRPNPHALFTKIDGKFYQVAEAPTDSSQSNDYSALPMHEDSTGDLLNRIFESQQNHGQLMEKWKQHTKYKRDYQIQGDRDYKTPRHVKTETEEK